MAESFLDKAMVDKWCAAYPEFAEKLQDAVIYIQSKPDIALFRLRQVLEVVVKRAYIHFIGRPLPENSKLIDLLNEPALATQVPAPILQAIHSVRERGNRAVHNESVTSNDVAREIQSIDEVLHWTSTWSPPSSSNVFDSLNRRYERPGRQYSPPASVPAARVSAASSGRTWLIVGVLFLVALVWLYISNLDRLEDEQQRNWLLRTHPSPQQPTGGTVIRTPMESRTAYVRNYPSSWPAPFFEEEIKPGAWGTWLEEPNWRHRGGSSDQNTDHDFIWYRCVEANAVEEANEWAIQCEDQEGIVRDVSAGKNNDCEMSRRLRIRNDWHRTAFVYYFAKHH